VALEQMQHRLAGELDVGRARLGGLLRFGTGTLVFFGGHRQREAGPQTQCRHGSVPWDS
jgi:hypothetical protein